MLLLAGASLAAPLGASETITYTYDARGRVVTVSHSGAVNNGRAEAGLIIHEGQLTYGHSGFGKIVDLGEWWKRETGLPLPLGGNVIRRDIPLEIRRAQEPFAVAGGTYLDQTFLRGLSVPAMTVVGGRVVASTAPYPPATLPIKQFTTLPDGRRVLFMYTVAQDAGIAIVAPAPHVGLMPGLSGWLIVLLAAGLVVGTGLAYELARVLTDVNQIGEVRDGEILVCPVTAPSWAPVFGKIKAAVSDIGGSMSHAAIVAREYGMPAVVGTGDATKRISTGQRVRVDGDRGIVQVIA